MEVVLIVAGTCAAFGVSAWLGYGYGVRCRKLPKSRYLLANGAGLAIGVGIATIGLLLDRTWVWASALGVMAGSLSGLKYGLGKTVGYLRRTDAKAPRKTQGR